jgi:methyltransferase FkbM-like protein
LQFSWAKTETASLSNEVAQFAYSAQERIEVDVTTIDRIVDEMRLDDVDFLKIDVEGLEAECLAGATHTIATFRPAFVQVEVNWHHLFNGVTLYAMSAMLDGYTAFRELPKGLYKVDPRSALGNLFAYSNVLFVSDELRAKLIF